MGRVKLYRWDRRKKRDAARLADRAFKAFWGFELLLIFLIFFIMLVGLRFMLIYAVTTSACMEIASSLGTSPGLGSVFDMFYWTTWLIIGVWIAVSVAFSDIIWKSKSAVVHIMLLIALVFALAGSNYMRLDKPLLPDGSIITNSYTVDISQVPPVWARDVVYGTRVMKRDIGDKIVGSGSKSCVWLDEGLIDANDYYILPSPEKDRLPKFDVELNYAQSREILTGFFTGDTFARRIHSRTVKRPLTEIERVDFIAKKACRAELGMRYDRYDECDYFWYDADLAEANRRY